MKSLLLSTVVLAIVSNAGQSLIQIARASNGKASDVVAVDQPVLHAEEMRDLADLVVLARVVSEKTRLSEDETRVVTEYVLAPARVLAAKAAPPAKKPGAQDLTPKSGAQEIRVRRSGGTVEVDGLQLTTTVDIYPADAALPPGSDAVFFLTRSPEGPYYNFTAGPYAVYRIRGDQVQSLTKAAALFREETVTFLAELIAIVERRQKQ